MFIRKKKNNSGSYTILLIQGERVPGKKHPVPKTIRNFGSVKGKKKIALLVKQAEEYKTKLLASTSKVKVLNIASELDIQSCRSYNRGFNDIYGSAFDSTFSGLNLKSDAMNLLHDLVVMRIAAPASKHKTTKLIGEYGTDCSVDSIYRLMDKINTPAIDKIKKIVYDNTKQLLAESKKTIDVMFYDLTTLYFETSTQDEIRNFGFSKDGKHRHVQIMLALIVTSDGLPIDYKEFTGNSYEGHTLIPVLNEIKERYNIGKVVLVADAALMNKVNLQELDNQGIKYIIAARIKNAKKEVKAAILDINTYDNIKETIKAKTIDSGNGDFLIAYYSTVRARKDEHDRQKDLERIEKYISSTGKSKLTTCLKKSYVKINESCKIEIDQNKLNNEKQYDGFFGLRTNLKDSNPLELLSSYRGLWQVEQTFRIAKNNLEIRPVFHYSPRRIRAHLSICYMALALVRYVEFKLKRLGNNIPPEQLHLLLDKMREVRLIDHQNDLFTFIEDPPQNLQSIYHALKIKWPKIFSCRSNL